MIMIDKIFIKIHEEGYRFLIIAALITVVLYFVSGFLSFISLVLTIWVYYFFRDPERISINDDNYLVSPADGIVLNVSVASAQLFCIPTYEELIKQTEEKELVLAWAGVARQGQALWFFINDTDWSVFFKDRTTGHYCTAPNYYGTILSPTSTEDFYNGKGNDQQ